MATIQDVARRARVSPATVSRVLNSSSTVHPDLVRRVRAAVEALSYQPNGVARRLRRRESPLWAVIVPDVGNPFFTSMVRGVEDVAQGSGYSVVLCNTDENTGKEAGYIAAAAEERMAGVIIAPASTRDTDVTPLLDLRIPVVALDRRLRRVAADTVLVDNEWAAEEATEHLLDMGYRRIACITGPGQAMTARERLGGYRRALRGHGHQARPSLVRRADFRERGGFEATGGSAEPLGARPIRHSSSSSRDSPRIPSMSVATNTESATITCICLITSRPRSFFCSNSWTRYRPSAVGIM